MTFFCKSKCLLLISPAPNFFHAPILNLANPLTFHCPVGSSLSPLHHSSHPRTLGYLVESSRSRHRRPQPRTSHLHHKTNSDTMDQSEEPKCTCKCGEVFDLYEPLATTSTNPTSSTDGVRKPARQVPHRHPDLLFDCALPVFLCIAAVCWLHTVYHYVGSVYF